MNQNTDKRANETPEQQAFREKARAWLREHLPPRRMDDEPVMDWSDKALVARDRDIQRALWDGGLAGITLPREYCGLGLGREYEKIFYEEAEPYRLPWHFGNAFNVVMPTLLAHGTEEQKKRYVPGILTGEHIWCQLLSEPSGGSDLAGLTTKAEQRGDSWFLNGSKVWTTGGMDCDMGICLARTDPTVPKHAGLTMFLVDMKTPGLTITPIKLISGSVDFCQEFFDDVEVPADCVLGDVNDGWRVASTQLAAEKAGMARGWFEGLGATVEIDEIELSPEYGEMARAAGTDKDSNARQLIGEAFVLDALYSLTTQRVSAGIRSGALPPAAGSLSSLMTALCSIRRSALVSGITGPAGVVAAPGTDGLEWGMHRVTTHRIGGGTLEMQRNGVAERYLELPRDEADIADRTMPFNERKTNASRADQ